MTLGKIGSTNLMYHGLTARSYVQDGLIVQLDGIENAGYGVHDANANVWRSLVGEYAATGVSGNFSFGDNALISANVTKSGLPFNVDVPSFSTMEICYDAESGSRFLVDSGLTSVKYAILSYNGGYVQCTSSRGIVKSAGAMYGKHGIAFTFSVNTPLAAYENGNPVALSSLSNSWATGKWCIGAGNGSFNSFKGKMFAYRLYSRALTAEEIAENHAVDKARFNLP